MPCYIVSERIATDQIFKIQSNFLWYFYLNFNLVYNTRKEVTKPCILQPFTHQVVPLLKARHSVGALLKCF